MLSTRNARWQILPSASHPQLQVWNSVRVPADVDRDSLITLVAEDAKVSGDTEMRLSMDGAYEDIRKTSSLPAGDLYINIITMLTDAGPRFRRIIILVPPQQEDQPFKVARYQNCTRAGLISTLQSAGVSALIRKEDIQGEVTEQALQDAPCTSVKEFQPEDGGQYYVIFLRTPFTAQVDTLEGRQQSMTDAERNAAEERAVVELRNQGLHNVSRYCGPKVLKRPSSSSALGEIDAAALAQDSALVLECQAILASRSAYQLSDNLESLRELVDEGVPAFSPFQGKSLHGALYGEKLTDNVFDRKNLVHVCKQRGYKILLPNGAIHSRGGGCTPSPVALKRNPTVSHRSTKCNWQRSSSQHSAQPSHHRKAVQCVQRPQLPVLRPHF